MARTHRHAEQLAYHEAGHAVMAVLLGLPITCATIVPDDQFLGRVSISNPTKAPLPLAFWVAGMAVDFMRCGRSASWKKDRLKHDLDGAVGSVIPLLTENWSSVEAVAAGLQGRGTLTGRDIVWLVQMAAWVAAAKGVKLLMVGLEVDLDEQEREESSRSDFRIL